MKILILGGKGMAGHMILSYLRRIPEYTVYYTSRDYNDKNGIYLNVINAIKVEELINEIRPDLVINCVGILNDHASNHKELAFLVNSLLPHQLAKIVERRNGKLIHISTDCVFSGEKGSYTEKEIPDGTSVYAKSKQLGEVITDKHLTIRTSIIGPELKKDGIGLFLWFMNQTGTIKGFKNVFWNGVTTLELAKAIDWMIKEEVTGLYHLASEEKISKYHLLKLIQETFNKNDVEIVPDTEIILDRTIKSTRKDFKYSVPSYADMLLELKEWMNKNE
jgi:dTDP-4-dehydrorhamnose reductase